MSTPKPTLGRILSETSHIITANPRHFSALSLLFLFPLSLATTLFSLLSQSPSLHSHYRRLLSIPPPQDSEPPPTGNPTNLISLYILFELILSLCALPSITHLSFHGYHGRPLNLASALKSIPASFLPLLATKLATSTMVGLMLLASALVMLVPYAVLVLLGFSTELYTSKYFIIFAILVVVFLLALITFYQIQWYLAPAVVVLESQWGFAPLIRSFVLVKGMRRLVFLTILFFSALSGIMAIWYSNLKGDYGGEGCGGWVIVQIAAYAALSAVLSLYSLVARTVLFVYCADKLQTEEKIDAKLGTGNVYVRVPSDVV